MQRLGILGGTFNPPHNGHIYIAREAMNGANLDKILFIPCGIPPHKRVMGDVDAKHRFEMTRLAIRDYPDFEITDLEIRSQGFSYTAKTLEKLKELYPNTKLCFVVGGDSLKDMRGWYRPQRIFELAEIVAIKRGGALDEAFEKSARLYRAEYGAEITVVDAAPVSVSSSEIRQAILEGKDTRGLVDNLVLEYIKKFEIYRDKDQC